ncbi:MAG: DHHW family protein [Oscillibacter sp.]|jgi:hypothetical protein|nr:DHHW family protein [Oscillibacter sp.]
MRQIANRVFLLLFALAFLTVPLLTLARWKDGPSFYEQRMLTAMPALSADGVWSGDYFTAAEQALSDHVCGRDRILRADTALDLAAGRPKVNNLVVGSDVLLSVNGYSRWSLASLDSQAEAAARRYASLRKLIGSQGGTFYYVGVPLQFTYFSDRYPSYMENRVWHTDAVRAAFSSAMEQEGVPFIDVYSAFAQEGKPDYLYFRTDHHYTFEGAFAAYELLMDRVARENTALSLVPLGREDFDFTTLPNPFLGSSNRRLYHLWKSSDGREDRVEIAVPRQSIPFSREDSGKSSDASVFSLPTDSAGLIGYDVYMGGDRAETVIRTNRPELPSVLIYGDSFTNPLETLLWTDFDETRSLDFRYYSEKTLGDYIRQYRPDVVICVRDESTFLSESGNGAWR